MWGEQEGMRLRRLCSLISLLTLCDIPCTFAISAFDSILTAHSMTAGFWNCVGVEVVDGLRVVVAW